MLTRRQPNRSGDSKNSQAAHQIKSMALQIGPNMKLPTLRELAETMSVSQNTVIDALDYLEARNVIYRKDRSGIYVSPRIHEKTIALVVGATFYQSRKASPFWDNLLALLIQESPNRSNGENERFEVHIAVPSAKDGAHLPKNFVDDVEAGLVHGVIVVCLDDEAAFHWIDDHKIPMAAFGGAGWPRVHIDTLQFVRTSVDELVRQGCRRIAFWAPNPFESPRTPEVIDSEDAMERTAFAEALAAHGAPFDPDLLCDNRLTDGRGLSNQQQGRELAERFIATAAGEQPDGIVIRNDMMTLGVASQFRESGIRIGRDVKIATHANVGSPILYGYDDVLTAVIFDPLEIVWSLYEMLDGQMESGEYASPKMVVPRLAASAPYVPPYG
jgi:DNA-binding LacI/PurR family transcriptional regulator/DNA-binding transcriptional regulator YhcF (GntR family)